MKSGDQRTRDLVAVRPTPPQQFRQGRLDAPQVSHPDTHIDKTGGGDCSRLVAVRAIVQPRKSFDFIQAEAHTLRPLHAPKAFDLGSAIPTDVPVLAARRRERASALTGPDRFHANAGRLGNAADGLVLLVRHTHLTPYSTTDVWLPPRITASGNRAMPTQSPPVTDRGHLTAGSRVADKVGLIGSIVAAMGCATCFPALASLGAAIGLGALSRYEGLFIHTLLPIFAGIALVANVVAWARHRRWQRGIPPLVGPLPVLIAVYAMLVIHQPRLSRSLLYPGLVLMLATSIWDPVHPACRSCRADTRAMGTARSR